METSWAELCYAELEVPMDIVESVAQMGSNDMAVAQALKEPFIKEQLQKLSDEIIDKIYNEFVGYDKSKEENEKLTREDKEAYVVWEACWQIADNTETEI